MQNLGHNHPKECKISCLVGLLNEKQGSSFAHFLYFSNPFLNQLCNVSKNEQRAKLERKQIHLKSKSAPRERMDPQQLLPDKVKEVETDKLRFPPFKA